MATATEQQSLNALTHLREALTNMGQLRQSLNTLREGGFVLMPDSRRIKVMPEVREKFTDPYHTVPVIRLCGDWLHKAGFVYNEHVRIITLHQLLIICPEEALPQAGS